MTSKYTEQVKEFINKFWKEFYSSPSVRDIKAHLESLKVSGGHVSTSHVSHILENELGYERDIHEKGLSRRIIPEWVKKAIKEANIEQES